MSKRTAKRKPRRLPTPTFSAACACRIAVHLWMTKTPACLYILMIGIAAGPPAVSATLTPSWMMTWAYSAYGGGEIDGRKVRLTALHVPPYSGSISWNRTIGPGELRTRACS